MKEEAKGKGDVLRKSCFFHVYISVHLHLAAVM